MEHEIAQDIRYIGVDDTELDLFESQYIIPEGISYNSYLILDEKVAILDTADARKGEEWKKNLHDGLGGRTPDYLIVHHIEPDHSGLIADVVAEWPGIKVVCSDRAGKMLANFFPSADISANVLAVKDGDELSLGSHTLKFLNAMMVHWPEVIVSYDRKEKVLFSADAFGKFGALSGEDDDWACEARRYYFNICGKYGPQVQRLLAKATALDIGVICPAHGPILRGNLGYYLGLYNTWSRYEVETEGILVAYASIHGCTKEAAEYVAELLKAKGCPKVALADLSRDDMAEAVEDAFRYGGCVLAASSYDASVFPPMYDFLHHLQLKAWQNRRVAVIENGSWAPSAARVMKKMLEEMKGLEVVEPHVTICGRMKEHDKEALAELADAMLAK